MNLEWSAVTLAGHVSLIVSVLFILRNALIARRSVSADMSLSMLAPLVEPVVFFLTALSVERAYYVMARALRGSGVNLWEAHPSPEVLAVALATMALWVAVAVLRIGGIGRTGYRRTATMQAMFVVLVFGVLSWGLW